MGFQGKGQMRQLVGQFNHIPVFGWQANDPFTIVKQVFKTKQAFGRLPTFVPKQNQKNGRSRNIDS